MGRLTLGAAAACGCAAALMQACESVPLTAAPGTTMTLIANPTFVIANGGVSVVTAILVEPAGTFVPDGTEVFFFTNLGRVDARGKTVNGVARVNFVSDARSGTATVTAISGGPAPAPSASPTAGTGIGVTASATTVAPTPPAAAAGDIATDENAASVEIDIGSALPALVLVSATPAALVTSRQATIVANVFDDVGNPVQNVPVVFQITGVSPATAPLQESLASAGAPQYTDSNGQAFDTLVTRATAGTTQKTVEVTATPAQGEGGTVKVAVNYTAAGR
ncbi:MAG TPA: hypothetical protein VLF95_14180 [Vicinamibacteria bacterium]|nr:hypothetical protein [Vicinamibacteria bacterium]